MIAFQNVAYSYGQDAFLRDVDLELDAGSFHFLTGPSGSGKTTFLRLCHMELQPTYGALSLFGRDMRDMSRDQIALTRRRLGVVHQDCRFLDHLPVHENIALPLTVAGKPAQEADENLADLVGWVGLSDRQEALPPALSGGERQRAALARAVITDPDIILADEPTGNVDWEMAKKLLALLIELNRMGKTILVATHDLNLIRQAKKKVSARVLRLKDGQVTIAGAEL